MNVEEWRKKRAEGELFTTPSGLEIRLRKLALLDLVTQGAIPVTLYTQVNEYVRDGTFDAKRFDEFEPLVNRVCAACAVSPRIVLDNEDAITAESTDVLLAKELPVEDRLEIFAWANQESGHLQKFRAEQEGSVDAV
jgi:hypothetical protein